MRNAPLQRLSDVASAPTGFDSRANYAGPDLDTFASLLVVLTRNRDSDILTESNWNCALKDLGGEGDAVVIHRFGHWACGWIEYLCVMDGTPEADKGHAIACALADYPVLDDADYSEREDAEAQRVWADMSLEARVFYIRAHRSQFEFRSFAEFIGCARGRYFAGYASELCHG